MNTYYKFEIQLPESIQVNKQKNILLFSGPLGSTGLNLEKIDTLGMNAFHFESQTHTLKVISSSKAWSGLLKKLLLNKIQGVTRGFLVYLKIIGIGYRASLENNTLTFKLGYSHDILYTIPLSVKVFLLHPTEICLFGIDKNQVTQIGSILRRLKKPSVYKGKGIRLSTEKIHLKTGKRK